MAPRMTPATEDGAKPGAETITPTDKHAFDADGRAKAREDAAITIGEKVFHRRRKSWEITRTLRKLLRRQERSGGKQERLRARIDALTEEIRGVQDPKTGAWIKQPITEEDRIEEIEVQVEVLQDEAEEAILDGDEAAYELIALLLRDDEGQNPDLEHLKDSLDVEDAGDLAVTLSGGGEPAADPTTTPTSSG